ncbi:MOSC domain-containing protein [Staphylococcus hyicus]|uniref:MOSC domain-containing protein n=1 Tax=Staphylococcus hyicus TaxID=1284 RepID=UPI002739DAEF|nr:MOSC domain-containing protein [Staphylococcus hyicus]MDP4468965.1 MOSC domain-containing protein [Staphylococcus hyicus]
MDYTIKAICAGKVKTVHYDNQPMKSGMDKTPIDAPIWLSKLGFEGDEQAYHGHVGPDKAVCLFSTAHYSMWKDVISPIPDHAFFGENISVNDIDENELYFGNQYQIGEAIIEVSEIREPCNKIQRKYQYNGIMKRMMATGKTGCYFRVIHEGIVYPNSTLKLIKEAPEDTRLSVQALNDLYYNDKKNKAQLSYAIQNPYITAERRLKLEKLLARCS